MKNLVIISFLALIALTSSAQNRRPAKSLGLTIDDYCIAIRSEYQLHKAEWEEIDRLRNELRKHWQTKVQKVLAITKPVMSPIPTMPKDEYFAVRYRALAMDMAMTAPKGSPHVATILAVLRAEKQLLATGVSY